MYVTFTFDGSISQYHRRQVLELKNAGYFVIAIRACQTKDNFDTASRLGDVDIGKVNVGYDFGSWWVGSHWLHTKLSDEIYNLVSICLCNDSFFGAVSQKNIAVMEELHGDVVGITDSYDMLHHVQSYFVIAKGQYLRSGAFFKTIKGYSFPKNKLDVIKQGELLLSKDAVDGNAGITAMRPYADMLESWIVNYNDLIDAEIEARDILKLKTKKRDVYTAFEGFLRRVMSGSHINPSHFLWHGLLDGELAIIKRELLFKNPILIPNFFSCLHSALVRGAISHKELSETATINGSFDQCSFASIAVLRRFDNALDQTNDAT